MFKRLNILILLLAVATLFAQLLPEMDSPLPVDPDLKIGTLPNGLTYYIKVNSRPEKRAELRLVAKIGSVQEDDDQQGLAHFTEHMAFNGTKNFPKSELVDYLNSIGMGYAGGLNAGTGLDQTVYQLTIPTDNQQQFRQAFLILSDWAAGVAFEPEEIEKERGVIIEEWRMGQGADQRLHDKTVKVFLADSRYAERMPIGKLEVLQTFSHETIKRFYNDWYRPDLQAVVAVGDFDANVVENLIKEFFSNIPTQENPREVLLYEVPDHLEPKVAIATDVEAPQTSVQLYWKHDRILNTTFEDYRNALIRNLHVQMLNDRLQEITLRPESPFSAAFNYQYNPVRSKSAYIMSAYVPESGVMGGLRALMTEAERVNRFGFTDSELERAKQSALRNAERMLAEKDKQDSRRLVWRFVGNFLFENPIMGVEQSVLLNRILYETITLDDVNRVCRELVTDSNLVIVVTGPEKEGLVYPTEEELLDIFQQVQDLELYAYEDKISEDELLSVKLKPGKVVSEKRFKKIGVKQWTLSNGVKVLLKQTDFKNDEILLRAFSPGGSSLYDLEDLLEAQDAANIINESGVGSFDAAALKKKLAGKIVNVEPFIYNDREGFNANSSVADLETMFQLIYLYATQPRLDEESFSAWLTRTNVWLQNEALNPMAVFQDSVLAFISDYHPRNRTLKAEDLPNLNRERILSIYKERFADFSDFTFIIVGSFNEKQLKDFCTQYLANLPSLGIKETFRDNGIRYAKGRKEQTVFKGQDSKSIVQISITEEIPITSQTGFQIGNLSLLMNEKLRENIREARSGVYFVGSWGEVNKYPVSFYLLMVYMQCAPERVEELTDAVLVTLDSLKAGMFDQRYVNTVKMTRLKRLETEMKDNRWWLSSIFNQVWNGFPLENLIKDRQTFQKMTKKELEQTAARYLIHDKNLLKSVLYPAERLE